MCSILHQTIVQCFRKYGKSRILDLHALTASTHGQFTAHLSHALNKTGIQITLSTCTHTCTDRRTQTETGKHISCEQQVYLKWADQYVKYIESVVQTCS